MVNAIREHVTQVKAATANVIAETHDILCCVAALRLSRVAGHGVDAALLEKLQAALAVAEGRVVCPILPGGGLVCAAATPVRQAPPLDDASAGSASLSKDTSAGSGVVPSTAQAGLVADELLDEDCALLNA
jgi:hypothetical protein